MLPLVRPMPLVKVPRALTHPALLWQWKVDGFRSLAYVERGRCRLFSRTGHAFRQFDSLADSIAGTIGRRRSVVLDGEIAVLGVDGRSQFRTLLARRGVPRFVAFDVLWVDGRDVRGLPLVERLALLRAVVPPDHRRLLYLDYVMGEGERFYAAACALDIEGAIGKLAAGVYQCGGASTSWLKVLNPAYSQMAGRRELFDKRRRPESLVRRAVRPRLVLA